MEKVDTRREGTIFLTPVFASGLVQARTPDATEADRTFVKRAIQGDLAEIRIGKLAQQRGVSEKVRQFGQRLEADHSANLEKTKPLAGSLGVAAPTAPNGNKLSSLSGKAFDRTFAKQMLKDHKKTSRNFGGKAGDQVPSPILRKGLFRHWRSI